MFKRDSSKAKAQCFITYKKNVIAWDIMIETHTNTCPIYNPEAFKTLKLT